MLLFAPVERLLITGLVITLVAGRSGLVAQHEHARIPQLILMYEAKLCRINCVLTALKNSPEESRERREGRYKGRE